MLKLMNIVKFDQWRNIILKKCPYVIRYLFIYILYDICRAELRKNMRTRLYPYKKSEFSRAR